MYGSIWAHYQFEQGPVNGLGFGGGVRYVGESPDSTNTVESDASTLLDLMASYSFGKWRVALNGTNVLESARTDHDLVVRPLDRQVGFTHQQLGERSGIVRVSS